MATASRLPSIASLLLIPPPKSLPFSNSKPSHRIPHLSSGAIFQPIHQPRPKVSISSRNGPKLWAIPAAPVDALPPETTAAEKSQLIIPTTDDGGGATVISVLLFVAFIGLSLLTIGIIYLAVQDFLQKRERDKFEKEEEEKKKKGGKRVEVKARAGPKGFGQRVEEEED